MRNDSGLNEIVVKTYDDAIKPAINGAKFCINFLISKVKPYMYEKIKESNYRIREIDRKLSKKYNKIPDENKTEPRISILGPAIETLKYNLDEEHIRELFVNILINEMDNRKQSKVLLAYIEIIKQITGEDAKTLKALKNKRNMIMLYFDSTEKETKAYINLDQILIVEQNTYIHPSKITLENLERLKILDIEKYATIPQLQKTCDFLFDLKKGEYKVKDESVVTKRVAVVNITDFGKNFIDICCS